MSVVIAAPYFFYLRVILQVDDLSNVLGGISSIFTSLTAQGTSLATSGTSLSTNLDSTTGKCNNAIKSLKSSIKGFTGAIGSFTSVVQPIPSDLSGFQLTISLYAVNYETLAFYVLWAITVVTIIVIAGFTVLKWRIPLQLSMLLALLCFLIQIIVTLLFMIFSGFLGNLCRRPTYTILNLLPAGSLQVRPSQWMIDQFTIV